MIVSEAEKDEILGLLVRLDAWVSSNHPGLPKVIPHGTSIADRHTVRSALYDHPELFDQFLEEKKHELTRAERELVASWKGYIRGRFFAVKALKSGTVLTDDKHYYLVLGLAEGVADLCSSLGLRLPVMLDATLLPFRGRIVYDGLVAPLNVHFGGGMRANMNASYAEARRDGRVQTSLEHTEAAQALAPPATRELDYLETLQQVRDSVEKLRGRGTREIQSPALALLRWSAQIAVSAFEEELDRHKVRKELGQLKRAYTQLVNALYDI